MLVENFPTFFSSTYYHCSFLTRVHECLHRKLLSHGAFLPVCSGGQSCLTLPEQLRELPPRTERCGRGLEEHWGVQQEAACGLGKKFGIGKETWIGPSQVWVASFLHHGLSGQLTFPLGVLFFLPLCILLVWLSDQWSSHVELLKFAFSLSPCYCLLLGHPSEAGKRGVHDHLAFYQGISDSDRQVVEAHMCPRLIERA